MGGRNSRLTSRQFMSQLFNYLTSHSAWTSILRMFSPWSVHTPTLVYTIYAKLVAAILRNVYSSLDPSISIKTRGVPVVKFGD